MADLSDPARWEQRAGAGDGAERARRGSLERDRFLEGGEPATVRNSILTSWQRSQGFGVSTDGLEPAYRPDLDDDSRLAHAARPVLRRLESMFANTPMSVILSDPQANVLDRRTGERDLNRHLDAIRLAPHFSYAEEYVGTNGIGTTAQERKPSYVFGAEHFSGRLREVSCAGAPIRNRLSGRLEGVLDLTCWKSDGNRLMIALAQQAAAEIEQRLLEQGTERERALLREFLAACRRTDRPIVTVNDELVIANAMASDLLNADDHHVVREQAADLIAGRRAAVQVRLSRDRRAVLHCRPVVSRSGLAGAVVEITFGEHSGVSAGTPASTAGPAASLPGAAGALPGRNGNGARRRMLSQWETLERDAIAKALAEAGGHKTRAAAALGISRATIYRKINTYGIVVQRPS